MAYVQLNTYRISGGKALKYCFGESPSTTEPPWVCVSIRRDVDLACAIEALRRLADEIEMDKWDPARL